MGSLVESQPYVTISREEPDLKPEAHAVSTSSARFLRFVSAGKTLGYQSVLFLVSLFPTHLAYGMACALGRIRYRRQRDARLCLALAMQTGLGAGPREAMKQVRKYFELKSWDEVETCHCWRARASKIDKLIEFQGLQNLDRALAAGKGAILCTGHFRGLFVLMLALANRGYKLNAIRRKPLGLQNKIGRWFNAHTTLMHHRVCRFLWMAADNLRVAVEAGKALKRNEVVLVLLDSRFAAQSVEARLLGRTVAIPSGPILIARKTGTPLLDLSLHLENHGRPHHVVRIGRAFYPGSDIAASVQHCVSKLEEAIVQEPASWTWLEDRTTWDGHQR